MSSFCTHRRPVEGLRWGERGRDAGRDETKRGEKKRAGGKKGESARASKRARVRSKVHACCREPVACLIRKWDLKDWEHTFRVGSVCRAIKSAVCHVCAAAGSLHKWHLGFKKAKAESLRREQGQKSACCTENKADTSCRRPSSSRPTRSTARAHTTWFDPPGG